VNDAVDLLDPAFYADVDAMHESLRGLRAQRPVWRDDANGLWAVLRHAEVLDVERRSDVFSSESGYRSFVQEPGAERDMIALDDPEHATQRALVSKGFTPRAIRRFEPLVRAVTEELVDAVVDRGEMEVVGDLAAPLPARLTAHVIGFPEEHADSLRTWSERLMRIDQLRTDPSTAGEFMGAIMEFSQLLGPLVEERRSSPCDDLVSTWAASELNGCPVDDRTIVQETGLFISGGAETTRTVIARGLIELSRHPEMWEALGNGRASVSRAIEELIRWVTPLNNFFRTASADTTIGDVEVKHGDRVILLYPSANRDDRVFDDPYAFDIARYPNPHIAFGAGTHFCLGASLARLELRVMLETLARRVTALEVLEQPDIEPNVFVSAVRTCRLAFRAR
jgi:cytochrome P450